MTNAQFDALTMVVNRIEERLARIETKLDIVMKDTNKLADKALFTGDAAELLLRLNKDVAALSDEVRA